MTEAVAQKTKTVVYTVSTLVERDKLIKKIYTHLTREPNIQYLIIQDQVNRVQVYHKVSNVTRILIRTYLVIIIPVTLTLSALYDLRGPVDFRLDDTINKLTDIITKLKTLQGYHIMKGVKNEQTLEQLVRSLSDFNGKH